ncbi:MAG: DNA (cytosine-5-)-methyltransferase [Anaerolineae bacterium]|nr:DNA (cytosine-5-)-methyltransferase [Anaerolineae bacterium]MBL8107174.1 DNA (cytosine-5-)-methyltransferase [Anaerolineales bacterium]MCC7188695.1 DNA (cytosine-5-)-methyltransferase [Anaerolineales bacterium]
MTDFTVIDFFCGAGGFSEGFRQQGFKIVAGIDSWKPAIDTFNFNFGLACEMQNILEFATSIKRIEELPDTDIILGSPPCVSFSSSNKSGKADKSLGLKLTKIFLRIVAVKKYKPKSRLKAWFMENVTNSKVHLPREYSFEQLGLSSWAIEHNYDPKSIAVSLENNRSVLNAANYGAPQSRVRVFSGEIIKAKKHIAPASTHQPPDQNESLPKHITLEFIRKKLPSPISPKSDNLITDPLYPNIKIKTSELTDQFYDTGLYKADWEGSKFLKTNHPYMGFMFFPEREDRPSRTVTATKIGNSREAIVLRSEGNRIGDGEYRTLTVREAATLMGFPITYQFIGSEGNKWKLVGNAVCPPISRAFAKEVRKEYKLGEFTEYFPVKPLDTVPNLNAFHRKVFDNPPKKKKGTRFRRHPFKDGNLTVTLSNYDIEEKTSDKLKWRTSVQYGTGEGFPVQKFSDGNFKKLEKIIIGFENGTEFIEMINNGFSNKIADAEKLQSMYENQKNQGKYLNPVELVDAVGEIINSFELESPNYEQKSNYPLIYKKIVPKKQLMALYAIKKICSVANGDKK